MGKKKERPYKNNEDSKVVKGAIKKIGKYHDPPHVNLKTTLKALGKLVKSTQKKKTADR